MGLLLRAAYVLMNRLTGLRYVIRERKRFCCYFIWTIHDRLPNEALAKLNVRRDLVAGYGRAEGRGRPFLA